MELETIEVHDIASGQEIRIPENFRIDDNKVYVKKMGNGLFIIPYHRPWQSLLDSLRNLLLTYGKQESSSTTKQRSLRLMNHEKVLYRFDP